MLRISGPRAAEIGEALTRLPLPPPRRAALRAFRDPWTDEPIDEGLLLWFPAPRSYTGEDLLEIQHHGSLAVAAALTEVLRRFEAVRPAEPGELTKRAFLNGKLDLTAAEAIADIVDATTRAQLRQAVRQLDGALGRLAERWREALLGALAAVEAEIDFGAEEGEVGDGLLLAHRPALAEALADMRRHLADGHRGERLRAGITVAVIGAPNAGKSSLVNLLARREVAIVTAIPGTTRDVIEVPLDLSGLPVTLLDTAGLRESDDPVEREGVARARRRAAQADLRLLVIDATEPAEVAADADLTVVNKIDRVDPRATVTARPDAVAISCVTGQGIDALVTRLTALAGALTGTGDAAVITRERHREAIAEAEAALARCLAASPSTELALLAEELRVAGRALGRVTGRTGVEDILDRVFASFCIGK